VNRCSSKGREKKKLQANLLFEEITRGGREGETPAALPRGDDQQRVGEERVILSLGEKGEATFFGKKKKKQKKQHKRKKQP